ncbi:MAG: M20/M25/M40 family metallo-hydrolase [Planctomycetes bacterium]|nr:M20/M25/M40 family metallo-hydrolase [Planctomycetota bacterium]
MQKLFTGIYMLLLSTIVYANNLIHYDIVVNAVPTEHFLEVKSKLKIPITQVESEFYFYLHAKLEISSNSKNITIKNVKCEEETNVPLKKYSLKFTEKAEKYQEIELSYSGKIYHPIKQIGEEYSRSFSVSSGIISEDGIVISGSSAWIPWFNNNLITFNMKTILPEGWSSVSQGDRIETTEKPNISTWVSNEPMGGIYFIAAKFTEYQITAGTVKIMAFLRTPDKNLANKYLETTKQYLGMYERLIGKYPYSKFALIENFWETGYGMPSFTLLGSKVIRFPFILHSSYPHELLHNWWGNSVYVDYKLGNWCEGLTVYLADHLISEQRGQGVQYRKTALQSFTDYVNEKNDFPIKDFRSRFNSSSSAIGYSKSMMLFHMLRIKVGDVLFAKAIRRFYADNKFKIASFDDICIAFEQTTGLVLKPFFNQWVNRKGAPEICLENVNVSANNGKYQLNFSLSQVQKGQPFILNVPIAIYLQDNNQTIIKNVEFTSKKQKYSFTFEKPILRIDVDPQFDTFRKLHFKEIPPTLSKVFGAKKVLIVLPSKAPKKLLENYQQLAQTWAKQQSASIEWILDSEIEELPADKAIWLFGWENNFKNTISAGLKEFGAKLDNATFNIVNSPINIVDKSLVISVRNPKNPTNAIILLSTFNFKALSGLGRKLPHYSKYSYLAFEGDEPTNTLKGQWVERNTPMTVIIESTKQMAIKTNKLPKRNALAQLPPAFSKENMMETVMYLASNELKGRGLETDGLEKARDYIVTKFKEIGINPGGDRDTYLQHFTVNIGEKNKKMSLQNVIGVIPGRNKAFNNQSLILCAHYDHLGFGEPGSQSKNKGKIHYGADDNASGVAVMLELAKKLAQTNPERTIIFIAFSGEESGRLGSKFYVNALDSKMRKGIIGVVNLDTVGRLGKQKLLVLGGASAKEWKFIFMGIEYTIGVGVEVISSKLDASDHASFVEKGIPAIQLFSGANADYHKPSDTVDKIDANGLVKVASVAFEVVNYLTIRKEMLTITIENADKTETPTKTQKRVGTGIMPDFGFKGKGVKIAAVSKSSSAEAAGLKKGDIIIKLGETSIEDLRQYSNALKNFKPGDITTIVYLRDGKESTVKITLKAR